VRTPFCWSWFLRTPAFHRLVSIVALIVVSIPSWNAAGKTFADRTSCGELILARAGAGERREGSTVAPAQTCCVGANLSRRLPLSPSAVAAQRHCCPALLPPGAAAPGWPRPVTSEPSCHGGCGRQATLYGPPRIIQGPSIMRPSGRAFGELRKVSITTGFARHAEGSALIRMGNTEVLCAASVETRVPPFLRNTGLGWVTAEYGMLPRATHTRGDREAARGKQSGRTQEIQRLIGRSLRAVVDRAAMGEMSITLDCDVLNADGGTRCAAITGAWVALSLAFRHLVKMNVLKTVPLTGQVAAVSCGIADGTPVLDLDYDEDSTADADANFVLTDAGGIVEIQATAEKTAFTEAHFHELLGLARTGTDALFALQREALVSDRREA
jgi:ribonuclease PH